MVVSTEFATNSSDGGTHDATWERAGGDDFPRPNATIDPLPNAPTRRSVMDEAIGVIMRENACGARRAADALRAAAQHQHVDVLDVAHAVLILARGVRSVSAGPA